MIDTRLEQMFKMQYEMQVNNSKKRPKIANPDTATIEEKIKAAMYYWNCSTVEFMEMSNELFNVAMSKEKASANNYKEEMVDILHFVLSQMIYLGHVNLSIELEDFFKNSKQVDMYLGWFYLTMAWGEILNQVPYKNWKTYEETDYQNFPGIIEKSIIMFFQCYINLVRTIGMDSEELFKRYQEKYEINVKRQEKGGRYEQ